LNNPEIVGMRGVASVLVFSPHWHAASMWWAEVTGTSAVTRTPLNATLNIGDVELAFCPADERNPVGGSPVVYWQVDDFNDARHVLRTWGCIEIHKPLGLADGQQITQFKDPYGIVFGIQGAISDEQPLWPEVSEGSQQPATETS
jgi:hypothetical protein